MVPQLQRAPRPLGVGAYGAAIAVLTELGFQVCVPLDPSLPFDLLASCDGALQHWVKVQVKGANKRGTIALRRGDKRAGCRRYVSGDFDLLVVVDPLTGTYVIPYAAIQHRRSQVCVRDWNYQCYRVTPAPGRVAPRLPLAALTTAKAAPRSEQIPLFAASGRDLTLVSAA
jgi:hypothetical protein